MIVILIFVYDYFGDEHGSGLGRYALGCDSLSLLCRELVDSELRLRVLGTEESSEGR